MYNTFSHSSAHSHLEPMLSPRASWTPPLWTPPLSAVSTAPLEYRSFPGPAMCLTCLPLCSSVASVGQLGFILWVTSSGRPFLTPTSRLNPPLYVLTASCSYSCYSIYQPLFSHKSMYCSHRTMKLTKFIVRSPTFGMVLINGPSINICWTKG